MSAYMTTREAATLWGISMRRINLLCQEGRIEGAYKEGRQWLLPSNASKPQDKRKKVAPVSIVSPSKQPKKVVYPTADQYVVPMKVSEGFMQYSCPKLPLPIGVSEYRSVSSEGYYVDKTLFIRDILDIHRKGTYLFTRPRRFGKTLNMDMLRTFFEISDEDTAQYFRDKKIWACGERYTSEQGKYPVIFLSLKDIRNLTWEETLSLLSNVISSEFARHRELETSTKISRRQIYDTIVKGKPTAADLSTSIKELSRMLHEHHGVPPIILIDEYDTPIIAGYYNGYYEQVINFMRTFYTSCLKDNIHIKFAALTGILRVAKESIFSGLNNLTDFSILEDRFSEYFGYTDAEVRTMAEYFEAPQEYTNIKKWYDGYRFGETDIFNPWSMNNYFDRGYKPRPYWVNTSSNDIISELLESVEQKTAEKLEALMQGKTITAPVDTGIVFSELKQDPNAIFSFLLFTGYLKAVSVTDDWFEGMRCELAIPNMELRYVYNKDILTKIRRRLQGFDSYDFINAVAQMDVENMQRYLNDYLMRSVSYYDGAQESFYHGLVLGLCVLFGKCYTTTSNREAGTGRYDIQLMPLDSAYPGIILEIKACKEADEEALAMVAQQALEQINERNYIAELRARNVKSILKYGVAFSGKQSQILAAWERY